MKEITQINDLIYDIKHKYPELRLCQIFSIAAKEIGWKDNDLFYLEDIQLLEGLKQMSSKYS